MSLRRIENLHIFPSVEGINHRAYPYTLTGNFMDNFPKMEAGNHDLSDKIKSEIGIMRAKSFEFDPEMGQLYIYGKMKDLIDIAELIARLEDEGWMQ